MASPHSPRFTAPLSGRKPSARNLSAMMLSPSKQLGADARLAISVLGNLSEGVQQPRPVSGSVSLREDESFVVSLPHGEV